MHASNKTVSEDEEEDDVFSRRLLFVVAPVGRHGCRRPTGGVFHMYLHSDTATEGVPHSDP